MRLEQRFIEDVPMNSRRGRKIWRAPMRGKWPKRTVIQVRFGRYVADQCSYDGGANLHVTWISQRHLYQLRGSTLKTRIRRRARRVLWGVAAHA